MKILFIGNTRLGDAILSTSILNYYSGSNLSITVVCSPLTENIYKNFSNVKDIIAVNKKKRGMHWLETYSLLERVCWDLVIDLRNSILSRLIRKKNVLRINSNYTNNIEKEIDKINSSLSSLTSFILPGGNKASSLLHLARTMCRRCEINIVKLKKKNNINIEILKYINRLSDLFFVLARRLNKKEILWQPRKGHTSK